jgi:hypothetical protein
VQIGAKWMQFWKGTGWLLFFFKFFLMSVAAYILWSNVHPIYGRILSESVIALQKRYIPIRDTRYTDDHGITVDVLMSPAVHEVVPLSEAKPVVSRIHLNTLYFNTIPFLALILATPIQSKKRLLFFIIVGFFVLSLSHYLHMSLNIHSYYYSSQTWEMNRLNPVHQQFIFRVRLLGRLQSFMEQAGSMIMPFLLWMFYAQNWLFRKLRTTQRNVSAEKPPSFPKHSQ